MHTITPTRWAPRQVPGITFDINLSFLESTKSEIALSSTTAVPATSSSIKTPRSLVIKISSSKEMLRKSSTISIQSSTISPSPKYNDRAMTSSTTSVSSQPSVVSVAHSYKFMAKTSIKETPCISSWIKDDRTNTFKIVPASSTLSHSNTKDASPKATTSSTASRMITSNKLLSTNSLPITRNSMVSESVFLELQSLSIRQSTSLNGLPNSVLVRPNEETKEVNFQIVIKGDVKKVSSILSPYISAKKL